MNTKRLDPPSITVGASWPEGVVDTLSLPCGQCDTAPVRVGFLTDDAEWLRVVDEGRRLGVLCIECFLRLGGDVTRVREIQLLGDGVTTLFHPGRTFDWGGDR